MVAVVPTPYLAGFRLIDGSDLNNSFAKPSYSTEDGITAHSGGTKAAAYVLTATINRISTSGASTDSVLLPPALAGRQVVVINDAAANAVAIYGAGTDTINDVATATLYNLNASSTATFNCSVQGKWYTGAGSNASFNNLTITGLEAVSANALVSAAGTNLTTATVIAANVNNLSTVGASTGVALPAGLAGQNFYIFNKGANNVTVYAAGGATIDGTAGATGVTLGHTAGTNSCIFFCVAAATYVSAKLGAVSS